MFWGINDLRIYFHSVAHRRELQLLLLINPLTIGIANAEESSSLSF